ncbi:MAG TPA: Gfo/Idh/MocA family oxidoreductase [Opitutus sp.]|nr:Gfo/Idh/MocA family oxidoreductase [Opitutus sp.]
MKVGLVGCGAVAQFAHIPALRALRADGRVTVAAVVDPDAGRRDQTARQLGARGCADLGELRAGEIELAVIASPARFHAEQAIQLLKAGCDVFCEKPLAATVPDGEAMVAAAREAGRRLGVGLMRRFYPALEAIREFVVAETFGALKTFEIQEGGPFNWPAATASFFDPKQAGGGVLLDAGVHVLDVLAWWLGDPAEWHYADDAEGGLEASCRLWLRYPLTREGVTGTVLLSRDWMTTNRWRLEFERAEVTWRCDDIARFELRTSGAGRTLAVEVEASQPGGKTSKPQVFTRQMLDCVDAHVMGRSPRVEGVEALRSLRLIEQCYQARTRLLPEEA